MNRRDLCSGALAGALSLAGVERGGAAPTNPAPPYITDELLKKRLEWFQDQKFGFFVHWGVYSQWGCIESWPLVEEDKWARPDDLPAWVERGKDIERFKRDYWKLNQTFNPAHFNPQAWADAAKSAGMRYFVFTTKHHDGFSMWNTRYTPFRITHPDCPFSRRPNPDVVRRLFNTFRREGFGIGAYFSKADWHHPDYWSPDAPARTRNPNYDTLAQPEKWDRFVRFVHGQIGELVSGYGPLDILWLDAGQVRPPRQDIRMDELVRIARNRQPNLIVVDRTVGGRYEDYVTPEQQVPEKPLAKTWESCLTMGDQWSYKPNDQYKSPRQLVHLLVDIVAKGGNMLLNVGPDADGQLPPAAVSRMKEMGDWLRVNGEAIYGSRPIAPYRTPQFALTRRGEHVYAIYLPEAEGAPLPSSLRLPVGRPKDGSAVHLLGSGRRLAWRWAEGAVQVELPRELAQHPPSHYAHTFRVISG